MTAIQVLVIPHRTKPECYICGCPCKDAGSNGRLVYWPVFSTRRGRFVRRRVRACANCAEDAEDE